jgi:Kef-type K+ transport system membrane component KefB
MRFSLASLGCLLTATLVFVARGGSDWSAGFAAAWWTVFVGAVALSLVSIAVTVATRRDTEERRVAIVVLALPALFAVPVLIWSIITLAPLAN